MYLFLLFIYNMSSISGIVISDAWIRPGAKGMNTAIYFTITNNTEQVDTLYDAKAEISNVVELHETYKKNEMMGMRKTEFVIVKGKSSFSFKPGAHHVMLIDLKRKLKVGEKYNCTLFFKQAGKIKFEAMVKK